MESCSERCRASSECLEQYTLNCERDEAVGSDEVC
jgi:hypothetical protein